MAVIVPKLPRTHRALCATGPGQLVLKTIPVPEIEPDQVLIKTRAVALNPSDHKLLDQSTTAGAVSGADFAGTVVKIGEKVTSELNVGDRVFGLVFGANPAHPENGAFGEYLAAPANLCLRIPQHMDFTSAASMGMAIMTTGLVFRSLGLRLDHGDQFGKGEQQPYVFVHGGATATGTMVIQMVRLAGYRCIATCSPRNFPLVKDRGAEEAFDYNSPSCKDQIRQYTNDNLSLVIDCIGNATTMTLCYGVIGMNGGHYASLEAYPRKLTIRRRNVSHDWILGWTLTGEEVRLGGMYHRPATPEDREYGAAWIAQVEKCLEQGKVRPHPLEPHVGGLAAVLPRLDQLREGKMSGKKLVFPL